MKISFKRPVVKQRKFWNRNPKTKIKESKKFYDRRLSKKEINEILKKEDM